MRIKEIAATIPVVREQHISGFSVVDGKRVPHMYTVDVNHQRRLRKAYSSQGIDGIKQYLDSIKELQKQHNDKESK